MSSRVLLKPNNQAFLVQLYLVKSTLAMKTHIYTFVYMYLYESDLKEGLMQQKGRSDRITSAHNNRKNLK